MDEGVYWTSGFLGFVAAGAILIGHAWSEHTERVEACVTAGMAWQDNDCVPAEVRRLVVVEE